MLEGGANISHNDTGSSAAFESEIKCASPVKEVCRVTVLCSVIWYYTYVLNEFTFLLVCEGVCTYWSAFLSVWFVRRDAYISEESVVTLLLLLLLLLLLYK